MEKLSDEDKEIQSILEINLDGLDNLGIEDASFRQGAPALPLTMEQRMAASPRLARLQAQWDKGEPGDNPSGLPMNRGMEQMGVTQPTLTYKATVAKTWDSSAALTKETYNLIGRAET